MNVVERATLAATAARIPGADIGTKPPFLWAVYEQYLPPLRDQPLRLLELGVHKGVSARALSRYFRNGIVVALDIALPDVDFTPFENLRPRICDQRNVADLASISHECAPDGWDIIIDDASHVGDWSLTTFDALFPHLKSGGLYFIEDWATGYMPTEQWGDGAEPTPPRRFDPDPTGEFNRRITSHDHGMAGFVKTLVDRAYYPASIFEWIHIHPCVIACMKR